MKDFLKTLASLLNPLKPSTNRFGALFDAAAISAVSMAAVLFLVVLPASATQSTHNATRAAASNCRLDSQGNIRHVIYLQFDNVHLRRDNPNVPSDLEQMPHLLNFLTGKGTVLANHHTPLISHTANDILTSITGVYGDRHGVPIANSYGFFNSDGSVGFTSGFLYWTDMISDPENTYNMLTADGKNAPAPWVPYTRAGCDVGAVGTANIELENTIPDVAKVFGANSPEAHEAQGSPRAEPDFVGIAIHCAAGGGICNGAQRAVPDLLPDEPGGYSGFEALFGHKYVVPRITSNGVLRDLNGNIIPGFPGFDGMIPSISLAYVAAMQESGVPVTFAYVADAHENHITGNAYGPGEAGYVAQLQAYDQAFAEFFSRLQSDGIDQSNTLFIITADEGDHFVGGPPSPPGCDGIHIPCTYSQIGELDVNMVSLLQSEEGINTPFDIHFDMAPSVYILGNPARTDPTVRTFERGSGKLTAMNPITGKVDNLTYFMADPVELRTLHMITADKYRTPTFVLFGNPDYYFQTYGPPVQEDSSFAWNHGGVAREINTTWLGIVGPGVKADGIDQKTFSDHTDIRPTVVLLSGLNDDYSHDGRALIEHLTDNVLPQNLRQERADFDLLSGYYKQINAPLGQFGVDSLKASDKALRSNDPSDATYTFLEDEISGLTDARNVLAATINQILENSEFNGQPIDHNEALQLSSEAQNLLQQMHILSQ